MSITIIYDGSVGGLTDRREMKIEQSENIEAKMMSEIKRVLTNNYAPIPDTPQSFDPTAPIIRPVTTDDGHKASFRVNQ